MRRKIGLGILFFLVNVVLGVVSFNEYLKITDRISNVELNQKALAESTLGMYDIEFKKWETSQEKTVTKLLKILGVDGEYDFNNTLVNKDNLKKFFDNQVYVKTNLRLEVPEGIRNKNPNAPKETQKGGESPAIVVGRYVLMASHTNDPESFNKEVIRFPMPQGYLGISFEFTVLEHMVTISAPNGKEITLKEIYRNREKDFSLFEMPVPLRALDFPFKIGGSDQLKVGNFIYMNGRPSLASEVARPGYVTSLLGATLKSGEEKNVKKDHNEFGISQSTEQGDSGSPIISFRDGKPELVGFYLGWVGVDKDSGKNTRSRALKINVAVDEIKKNTGIDLRELQRNLPVR